MFLFVVQAVQCAHSSTVENILFMSQSIKKSHESFDHRQYMNIEKIRPENTKVLMSEDNFWKRKVNEAIEIRQRRPSLKRDEGLELPRVYHSHVTLHRSCDLSVYLPMKEM